MAKINKYWGLVAVGALTAAAAGAIAAIISRKSVCEDDFEDDFDDLDDIEEDEKKEEKEETELPDKASSVGSFLFIIVFKIKNKAADGNRTRDLRLTKATLYRLSHSSLFCDATFVPLTVEYIIR